MSDSPTSLEQHTPTEVPVNPETVEKEEEELDLSVVLLKTVNHVFSRDYMSHDPTFVAHLEARNNEFYAPLQLVAELPIIKSLSSDLELIKKALATSDQVIFDEETQSAKPTFKLVQRTTLILRDIPSSVTPEEVKAIFSEDENLFSSIVDIKPEVGDNYFVRFDDEEKTMNAFNFVRTKKHGDKPIQARIKYYVDPAVLHYQQQQQQLQNQGGNLYSNTFWDQRQGYNYRGRGGRYNNTNTNSNNNSNNNNGGNLNNRRGRNKDYNGGRKPGGRNAGLSSGNNKRGNFVQPTKDTNKTPNAPLHVTSHWPPLLQMDKNQSGYKKPFQKYSREQVVAIVNSASPAPPTWETCPASIQHIFSEHPTSQMEILRPIHEVEFAEGKRKHRKSKSHKASERRVSDAGENKHSEKVAPASQKPEVTEQTKEEAASATPTKGYADAAKVAAVNSS